MKMYVYKVNYIHAHAHARPRLSSIPSCVCEKLHLPPATQYLYVVRNDFTFLPIITIKLNKCFLPNRKY